MWGKLILQNALIVEIISLFGWLRWCMTGGRLLPFIIFLSLLQLYLQITKFTVFKRFHQTLFFPSSYWLKYEYLKFMIFGVTMPYAFETQFPRPNLAAASSSGEICGCSAHLRNTQSRVYKQIKKLALDSQLWNMSHPSIHSLGFLLELALNLQLFT